MRDSETSDQVVKEASRLLQAKEFDKADSILSGFLVKHPNDSEVLNSLALVREDQQRTEDARQLLILALNSSPNSIHANNSLGELLLSQRQYPEAMDRFETVLRVSANNRTARSGEIEAATQLAIHARKQGNQVAALAALQHALESLPEDPTLLLDAGIQEEEMGLWSGSEALLRKALAARAADPTTLYALSRVEMDEDKLPASEAHMRAYLNLMPEDASAHFGLGRLLYKELRIEQARAEFERSIQLQPLQTESYYELGQIELDAHKDAAAVPLFEKTLARSPTHGGALAGLGIVAYRAKDYAKAESYLAAAVKNSPDFQLAHYYYGLSLAKTGDKALSDKELAISVELGHAQEMAARQGGPQRDGPVNRQPQ